MDGVYTALTVTLAQTGRSLIVVCTDGYDVSSWLEPSEVIDAGQLVVEIGIAPVKPAEFVVFRIAQFSGGTSLAE